MDALPDELLLHILRHLTDGFALLDVVPRVCRRWQRLCRDPRIWGNVSVDSRQWRAHGDARVLLHAPALLRLILHGTSTKARLTTSEDRLPSAVVRSLALVRETLTVSHSGLRRLGHEGARALLRLLWRSRDCLKHLQIPWLEASSKAPSPLCFADVLSRLKSLEKLHLHVTVKASPQYSGQLRWSQNVHKLREIEIYACKAGSNWSVQRTFPEGVVRDLIHRAGPALRSLKLDGRWPVAQSVLRQLDLTGSCLRDLAAHCSILGVTARTLSNLETLSIGVLLDQEPGMGMGDPDDSGDEGDEASGDSDDDGDEFGAHEEFMVDLRTRVLELVRTSLSRCEVLPSLRTLEVTVTDVDLAEDAAFLKDCGALFDTFRERRSNVHLRTEYHVTFR